MLHNPPTSLLPLAAEQSHTKKSVSQRKILKDFQERKSGDGPAGRKKDKTERVTRLVTVVGPKIDRAQSLVTVIGPKIDRAQSLVTVIGPKIDRAQSLVTNHRSQIRSRLKS